ncbi:MAG: MaoC family dehydratase [Chloroflexi bacterium]|nr:MaoC family dehydratase [Chloroflexota bacterium]
MPIDYAELLANQVVSDQRYVLDDAAVSAYVEAVGDTSASSETAPPMAIAALSLRGVVQDLAIPGGTLHVGQEIQFKGAVSPPETLDCRATLLQNSVRGEWRFLVVRLEVEDSRGTQVMEGKSTIMVPA